MSYKIYNLDKRAKDYIYDRLQYGHTVLKALFKNTDCDCGKVLTYLPDDVESDYLYKYDHGAYYGEKEIVSFLIDIIQNYLQRKRDNIVFFENFSITRRSECIVNYRSNITFHNDELYFYLTHRHSDKEMIDFTIRHSRSAWQNIFFMKSIPDEFIPQLKNDLNSKLIDILTKDVDIIVSDAYDFEGYIIWDLKGNIIENIIPQNE